MRIRGVVIFMLTGLLCSCQAPNDNIIVPGKRVGRIVIGHTKASEVGPGDGSVSSEYNNQGFGFGFDQHLRVDSIDVTRSNFRTREGLSIGCYRAGGSSRVWPWRNRRCTNHGWQKAEGLIIKPCRPLPGDSLAHCFGSSSLDDYG
jgi:hypothetical protein